MFSQYLTTFPKLSGMEWNYQYKFVNQVIFLTLCSQEKWYFITNLNDPKK